MIHLTGLGRIRERDAGIEELLLVLFPEFLQLLLVEVGSFEPASIIPVTLILSCEAWVIFSDSSDIRSRISVRKMISA